MTSNELYNLLQKTFTEAEKVLGEGVYISIYGGAFGGPQRSLSFKLSNMHYSSKEFTVEGKDFWQCVEEYKHRKAFAEQQEKLMLGAPIIEGDKV